MAELFSPRRADGRAEWRVIYDVAVDLPYGADLTYDRLAAMLEVKDRGGAHRAVRRCNKEFLAAGVPRVLGNVRNVGYRVFKPGDYTPAALNRQKRARRQMSTAVDLMRVAPINDMTPAQREWAHRVQMVLIDNELRLRNQETWRSDAERRIAVRWSGLCPNTAGSSAVARAGGSISAARYQRRVCGPCTFGGRKIHPSRFTAKG